ncbi:MAG: ABC transporter ATP-binding protein [Actinomycetia bacterium]|nr:ABC transporter ATP-binding protein [Actinomycetes bacterium]
MEKSDLILKNIDFSYDGLSVIQDVSFTVRPGEILGIIGPNGSGKTTLLNIICGLLKPNSGDIFIQDKNIKEIPRKELYQILAIVPQDSITSFNYTVLDIVLMGRTPYLKGSFWEREIDYEIAINSIKDIGIYNLKDKYVSQLSGGERQKVTIAQALSQQPKILLLDEPTTHLDINSKLEIMNLITRLNKEQKITVITIFHDINLAASFCPRILILSKGRIFAKGNTEDVLTSQNLEGAYNIPVVVKKNPITNRIYTTPINRGFLKTKLAKRRLHLICGGGSGSLIMSSLKVYGFLVSCGVLNVMDTDYETAKALEIPIVSEAPFSQISNDTYKENIEMIKSSEILVLANVEFGYGNLSNLKAIEQALDIGKKVMILQETSITERDYTEGKATEIYKRIIEKGAILVHNVEELFRFLY